MISMPMHPPTAGPVRGGFNMLIPLAFDDAWTGLDEVFNEYPGTIGGVATATGGYQNPNRSATIPIGPNTQPAQALVSQNPKRVSILMQNNSVATVSGDVPPTMYFNFGAQAQVGIGIGLAPGVGLVLDNNVQADSLYVTFGPSVNTGGSVVIQGAVLETSSTN
jgi:hypothetical protein